MPPDNNTNPGQLETTVAATTPSRRRLRDLSRGFTLLVALAIAANLAFLAAIGSAFDAARTASERRDSAMALVRDLRHETDLLARLVRAYVATADARYLMYYYDILAVRAGEKPAPQAEETGQYWEHVIAGRRAHALPAGNGGVSLAERMHRLAFDAAEQQALARVVQATERLGRTEQIAFAATQGLYDTQHHQFVSDGQPDLAFARNLVHGRDYAMESAALTDAVSDLAHMTDERTAGAVTDSAQRLRNSIAAAVAVDAALAVAVLFAWRGVRQRVLRPVAELAATADRLAAGDYDARVEPQPHGLHEFAALSGTLGDMAASIRSDIAERERHQRELETARAQAEAATQAKSMFLANMSHEIRTPMNAIIGMTHLALATSLDAQQRDYLDKVQGAATMLLGVLNDILDFSKIEAGKLELESVPCMLEEVVGGALPLVRERALDKDLELLCDLRDPALLTRAGTFWGDPLRLGQVLVNLLSNAVKFTERGHVRLAVDLESHDDGEGADASATLVFSVHDTGVGMTTEQLGRLFQEFTQADGSTTRRYGGTGLGLSIARRLVTLMQGTLEVRSDHGRGSCFTVRLPVRLAAGAGPAPELAGMRVLVVDDQDETRDSLIRQLAALGVGTASGGALDAAANGADALRRCDEARAAGHAYDLLLLDWVLPDVDGGHVLRGLREAGDCARVVVISAYGWDDLRREIEIAGADAFVAKPVLPAALRRALLPGGSGPAPAVPLAGEPLRGLRVMLVEDNPVNRQLATELLSRFGATIECAEHGREAIELLERRGAPAYDLVLMDLQMPVMDGYEATRAIRAHAPWRGLPIVAMTAHAMVEERERCLALGMRGHIAKPLNPAALVRELASYVPVPADRAAGAPVASRRVPAPRDGRSATPAPPMPAWPGIDVARALALCGGEALLRNGLTAFANQYAGYPERLRDKVVQGRWDALARAAHTLKGLGGQLGMTGLADAAAALDHAFADGARDSAAVESMAGALSQVLRALDAAPPWPRTDAAVQALEASQAALDELRELLAAADSEALGYWQARRAVMAAALSPQSVQSLEQAIQQCDFDAAMALLPASRADEKATSA